MAEKPSPKKVLESVVLLKNVTVFNQNSASFSNTMTNITLTPDGKDVVVTHDGFPGVEERLHEPNIAKTVWKEPK